MNLAILNGVYAAIYLAVTLAAGRTLARSGRLFLAGAFRGDPEAADSASRLLLAGFYLINAGFLIATLQFLRNGETGLLAVQVVADRVGRALVVLGIVYFVTLHAFHRLRPRNGEPAANTRGQAGGGWQPESGPLGKVLE
ncbi:MAG TPA: hypothetical protein VMG35_29015 [Bryobacteraceae bacterium]|nr:hypothetical protein [Bryobacteraceae bacterium]